MTNNDLNARRNGQYCIADADLLEHILTAALARMDALYGGREETTMGHCYAQPRTDTSQVKPQGFGLTPHRHDQAQLGMHNEQMIA
jgi:hypothetical protein